MLTEYPQRSYLVAFVVLLAAGLALSAFSCSRNAPNEPAPAVNPGTAAPASRSPALGTAYENKLLRRPGNTPEDGKVYVVQNGKKRWVVNTSWFAANGYKFPDDVREIPAVELDAIPMGDAIQ